MIIIRVLKAGVGNQLFEYAYGRYLAQKYNQKLYMYFPAKMAHGYTFENGLGSLDIKIDQKINWVQMTILSAGKNILHFLYMLKIFLCHKNVRINLFLEKTKGEKLAKRGILVNYDVSHMKDYFDKDYKIAYARGYFQFPKFVYENKAELVALLKFQGEKLEKYGDIIQKMQESNSVCIHVRRGDFLKRKMHTVCDDNYYSEAVRKMNELLSEANFFVFSDECDYVRSKIFWFDNKKVCFIQDLINKDMEDIDELKLMGYCKHFIISNSSFSWWGQFAGTDSGKIVIAPDKWYASEDKSMLYEKDWHLITTGRDGNAQ